MSYDKYFDEAAELVEIVVHAFDLSKHERGDDVHSFFLIFTIA